MNYATYTTKKYHVPNQPFIFTGYLIEKLPAHELPFFTLKEFNKIEKLLNVTTALLRFEIPINLDNKRTKVFARLASFQGLHEISLPKQISSKEDIELFFKTLLAEGTNFHPDDDFRKYVNYANHSTGNYDFTYTYQQAKERTTLMNQSFDYCKIHNLDIYEIGLEIMNCYQKAVR